MSILKYILVSAVGFALISCAKPTQIENMDCTDGASYINFGAAQSSRELFFDDKKIEIRLQSKWKFLIPIKEVKTIYARHLPEDTYELSLETYTSDDLTTLGLVNTSCINLIESSTADLPLKLF